MRTHRSIAPTLAVLVALALGTTACVTGGPPEETRVPSPDPDAVTVQVHNNLTAPSVVRIALVDERGVERWLGSVKPSRTARLVDEGPILLKNYHLVAELDTGGSIISRRIPDLTVGMAIDWSLSQNDLTTD